MKIISKIRRHGIIGSFKVLLNKIGGLPGAIRWALVRRKSLSDYFVKEIQGSLMILNKNDIGISKELILTGVHEKSSTETLRQIIKPGMRIAEVGANIGYYALMEAQLLQGRGAIYAFEPSPINMHILRANVALNTFDEIIKLYQYGIGDKQGELDFHLLNKGNMSSFLPRQEDDVIKETEKIKVPVARLDACEELKNASIDLVRMDVEGYEFNVIEGMVKFFEQKNGPKYLFIEVHSELLAQAERSGEEFVRLLQSYGYEIFIARYRGREDIRVESCDQFYNHKLREKGYWEIFFQN